MFSKLFSKENVVLTMESIIVLFLLILLGTNYLTQFVIPVFTPVVTLRAVKECPEVYDNIKARQPYTETLNYAEVFQSSIAGTNNPGYVCLIFPTQMRVGDVHSYSWMTSKLGTGSPLLLLVVRKEIHVTIIQYSGGGEGPATSFCVHPWDAQIQVWDPETGISTKSNLITYCKKE